MIVPIVLLLLLTFIQSALLPFDLILIVIIVRSFLMNSRSNYYLAFLMGLLVAFLSGQPLGIMSIVYLLVVKVVHSIRLAAFASHWSVSIPVTFITVMIYYLLSKFLLGISLNLWYVPVQMIMVVPLYLIIGFWEERFIGRSVIKLKI
ncbi:hypothetical protein A3C32_03375 [Candidatus Daviesbacteria bacterium RIFCSPHIGHO2_02_FULL_41_14]|uniref:Rod shape-determining protein MreD n=1 Tax=Candidatus Daviesbacteria bacterium RIFCSPLOWO2_01_FULL_40_24 TaxID=1797787 RepID=A0A1F5MJK1_9BACT|nr:MAG: hypothetical protein A2780_02800 [Candidatus Daviesbacteria bacterium RIFCSPHIGHO2_01_FULL_41_45]OGE35467.1 MAG: hypothetical protein A3C32_03375 [Candidatus Daviesbacteria bacterium RIFCSPHIGHO2_02_FULL_41_14]OGE65557.1 MAG: hypothetical protein A3B49_01955 [Candidatus Daviesbacteria bacterium RIFCSPLOWO2_01_FULL_40_24]